MKIILISILMMVFPFVQIVKCETNKEIKIIEEQINNSEDLSKKSTDPSLFVKIGNLYWEKGELLKDEKCYKESIINFRKALVLDANWIPAKIGIGKCYYRTGWIKPAKDIFEDVLKFYPNDAEAASYLEKINENLKNKEKVKNSEEKNGKEKVEVNGKSLRSNEKGTKSKESIGEKAVLFFAVKKYDDVIKVCEEGVKIYPDYWPLYELLGKAYKKKGDEKLSKEMFLKVKEFNPSYRTEDELTLEEKQLLGINEMMEKALDEKNYNSLKVVIDRYDEILKKNPKFIDAYFRLGAALSNLPEKEREIDKEIGIYKQVLILEPKNTYALYRISKIYQSTKKYDKALELCNMILDINADDKSAMYNKITILSEMLEYQKVADECEKILSKYPDDMIAKSSLKTVNSLLKTKKALTDITDKRKKESDEKKSKLEQAVKDKERMSFAVCSDLGNLYWDEAEEKGGDTQLEDSAFELWKKALELAPNWIPAQIHIGKYYYKRKMNKEALEQFNHVLELVPKDKTALEYIKKIEEEKIK